MSSLKEQQRELLNLMGDQSAVCNKLRKLNEELQSALAASIEREQELKKELEEARRVTFDLAVLEKMNALEKTCTAQLAELHAISEALGTNEGHSSVDHIKALRKALEMMYDKYEEGMPCYENPDESEGFVGNAIRLSSEEEDSVLALIPAARGGR